MRAEDGRAGTSAAGFPSPRRPADASEDPSDPRARGSRGATVASVALAGCVALAGVVTLASRAGVLPHLIPPRAGALASPSVHSPTASPDLDIPEVFVITGRDADGPTGEWRRVDAATKAQMEAEALKAEHPERKSRTSESTKSEFETSEPGAVEPDVDNPDAVALAQRILRRRGCRAGHFVGRGGSENRRRYPRERTARGCGARRRFHRARRGAPRDGGAETRTRGAQIATIAICRDRSPGTRVGARTATRGARRARCRERR